MRTWSVIENDAVVAPTPSAVTTITVAVNPGERLRVRAVYRRSCRTMSQWLRAALTRTSATASDHSPSAPSRPEASRCPLAKIAHISAPYSARKAAGYRRSKAR